jgi:hypothetical protein
MLNLRVQVDVAGRANGINLGTFQKGMLLRNSGRTGYKSAQHWKQEASVCFRWYLWCYSSEGILSGLNVCQLSTRSWRHHAHSFVRRVMQGEGESAIVACMMYNFLHLISHLCVPTPYRPLSVYRKLTAPILVGNRTELYREAPNITGRSIGGVKGPGQLPYIPHLQFLLSLE